jgi:hypothetical protein
MKNLKSNALKTIALLLLALCVHAAAQTKQGVNKNVKVHRSFENLREVTIKEYEISVKYDPSISEVIAKKYKHLNSDYKNTFPGYKDGQGECDCTAEFGYVILKTKLNRSSDKYYYIDFWICPEPEFRIFEEGNKTPLDNISATALVIPGNGSIYTSGHMSYFNARQKYDFVNNKITEVPQPFYYVGLKSHTLRTVNLYQDTNLKKVIATLPPNNEIEILLSAGGLYLARTSFGLVGWTKLEAAQYRSVDVEGLFYNND